MNLDFFIHKADLQASTEAPNAAGQIKATWAPVLTNIDCYIRGLNGNEIIAAEKIGYTATYRMYCTKDVPAQLKNRIVSSSTNYEITFINNQVATHLQIDLKVTQ